MKKIVLVLIAALSIVGIALPARAATVTVTGQLVDLYCYDVESKANSGMDHQQGRNCAWACAKWEGQPVGLVTADGKLYQLEGGLVANNNEKVAPHISHTVTITGETSEKAGMTMLS